MRRAWLSWSSGKDSAWALHVARRSVDVVGLLTTVTTAYDRVAMHGVRRELLEVQAERVGLPLHVVEIPSPCPNEIYEVRMGEAIARARGDGVEAMVFGDLFLADIREYRERMMAGTAIEPVFPLWGRDTAELATEMLAGGVQARITCLDPAKVPRALAGTIWDPQRLPPDVDPCGEHGEFHTFVTHAPGFAAPIDVAVGEIVDREGFVFADVLLYPGGGKLGVPPSGSFSAS
jgi:uncharacterized protein (TIGR00290 family)